MNCEPADEDYFIKKQKLAHKWRGNWEAIFRKYDQKHENSAIIDLETLQVVRNKEFLHQIPCKHVGRTVFACNKRSKKKRSSREHEQRKYDSSDSAVGSLSTVDSSSSRDTYQQSDHFPALGLLDFTNGDSDETGMGCVRYQYDDKTGGRPILSGPQELLGVEASSSVGYESGNSDDEDDNASCRSGPVSEDGDFSSDEESQDRDDTDDDAGKEKEAKTNCHHSDSNKRHGNGNRWHSERKEELAIDRQDSSESFWGQKTNGYTSILEAKENFVKNLQRYFMNPMDSEQTEGSDILASDSETTTASNSDHGYSQVPRKHGLNDFKTPVAPNLVSVDSKSNNQYKKVLKEQEKVQQDMLRSVGCELNEYSTIIAGNFDEGLQIPVAESTAIDICVEDEQVVRTDDHCADQGKCLDRTVGGGLQLPTQGAKHIVIGSIPSDRIDENQISPSSPQPRYKTSLPERLPSPFLYHQDRIFSKSPCTPKIRKLPKMPRTPKTPSSACKFKPQEMLQIFQSPLPIEVTPTKSKRKGDSTSSPSAFKFRFEQDSPMGGMKGEQLGSKGATFVNRDIWRPSPLAKALKKMKEAAKEEDCDKDRSPMCRTAVSRLDSKRSSSPKSRRFDETFVVSTKSRSPDIAHMQSEKTRTCQPSTVDSNFKLTSSTGAKSSHIHVKECIDERNDTYEFRSHSLVTSATNTRTKSTKTAQGIESEDDCILMAVESSFDETLTDTRHGQKSNLTINNQDQRIFDSNMLPSEVISTSNCDIGQCLRWKESPKKKRKLMEPENILIRDDKKEAKHIFKSKSISCSPKQVVERNDSQCMNRVPCSPHINSPCQLKIQAKASIVTSTPIKKGNQQDGDREVTPVASKSYVRRMQKLHQKEHLSKKAVINSSVTPTSRHIEMQRQLQSDEEELPQDQGSRKSLKKALPRKTTVEKPPTPKSRHLEMQSRLQSDDEELLQDQVSRKSLKKVLPRKTTVEKPPTPKSRHLEMQSRLQSDEEELPQDQGSRKSLKKALPKKTTAERPLTPKVRNSEVIRETHDSVAKMVPARTEKGNNSSKKVLSKNTKDSPVTQNLNNLQKMRQFQTDSKKVATKQGSVSKSNSSKVKLSISKGAKDSPIKPKSKHLVMHRQWQSQYDATEMSSIRTEQRDDISLSRITGEVESPMMPKSSSLQKQRKAEVMSGQTKPKSRYVKKCANKLYEASPSKDVRGSSVTDSRSCVSDSSRSITLHSTDTLCNTSGLNSSMSTSVVACEGPGLCNKMFCFTCAVGVLS